MRHLVLRLRQAPVERIDRHTGRLRPRRDVVEPQRGDVQRVSCEPIPARARLERSCKAVDLCAGVCTGGTGMRDSQYTSIGLPSGICSGQRRANTPC